MEKLLLIDGHSMLNRAYYALPPLSNSKGIYTNAVLGFLNIMQKFLETEAPDYFAVAFDEHGPTFRHQMFPEYKGTRKAADEEFRMQVPMIQELLLAMDIPVIKQAGIEADDILGTIAKSAQAKGLFVSIVSGDRDLFQLCDDHIKLCIPRTKKGVTEVEAYTKKEFIEETGVTPTEFIDVKALMGDSSDNIPGVAGIGEKGAFSIIKQYKNIETAYENLDSITPKRAMEGLRDHMDMARLSKELATIKTDCDISLDMDAARLKNIYTEAAHALCTEWELKSILKKFNEDTAPVKEAVVAIEKPSVSEALGDLQDKCIGIAFDGGNVALSHGGNVYTVTTDMASALTWILENTDSIIACGNLKDEILSDTDADFYPHHERFFDIFIAAYLIDPTRKEYTFDSSDFSEKALFCQEKYHEYSKVLVEKSLEKLFYEVEMPLVFILSDMEKSGIALDTNELGILNQTLSEHIASLEQEIYKLSGSEFNINSPKQLGEILFEKMGLPGGKKTKTGYSTSADVLQKLSSEHPIVEKILMYRQYSKLKSTYAEGLLDCVRDGRVHTTFQQTVTATGRLSSTDPNLQNIPVRTELGRNIRKVFYAPDGYVFVDADYSQIELRVLAHMSEDENLISAYRENKDIHSATAAKVFGKSFEDVTPEDRRKAKAVNFGIVYGISSFGLGEGLNISKKEAQGYIDDYYLAYPKLKAFLDGLITDARATGYSHTLYGRIRPVPEVNAKNFIQKSLGERICMNTPIQGTAADIIKIAMIRVYDRLKKENMQARLILQVHDELIVESPEDEAEKVSALLKEEMEAAASLHVPLIAEVHQGRTWYEAK